MSHGEYVYKTYDLKRKWVKGEKAENYDELFDLFAQEHFLSTCSEEIRDAIQDKSLGSVQEVADLADSFVQATVSNECKKQKERQKHRVKGEAISSLGKRRVVGSTGIYLTRINPFLGITFTNLPAPKDNSATV